MIRVNDKELNLNIFTKFKDDWALLTAGDFNNKNSMTVSWGFMGTLWGKNVICVFVRPTRYTYHLMEENERFTLSFMPKKYKKEMTFMGTKSGLDIDKYKETGLIPVYDNDSFVSYIKDADIVFKCRTLYSDLFKKENFKDIDLFKHYKEDMTDLHKFYIAEVTSILRKEDYEI